MKNKNIKWINIFICNITYLCNSTQSLTEEGGPNSTGIQMASVLQNNACKSEGPNSLWMGGCYWLLSSDSGLSSAGLITVQSPVYSIKLM